MPTVLTDSLLLYVYHYKMNPLTPQSGFTLIELSIVLVIIGLIVGGVLVGQDLIKAAGIRATVQQIEKYNGAVNTFNGKYNGLPGDISTTNAAAFGLTQMNGAAGRGDNNGLIDGTVATPAAYSQEGCEFWVHLSQANLLDGSFTQVCDAATPVLFIAASIPEVMPVARIQKGNYINVGSASGLNFFMIGGITATTTLGAVTSTVNLTPIEAYSMDTKMDDGAPLTGLVQVHATAGSSVTAFIDPPTASTTSGAGMCLMGDMVGTALTDTYNVNLITGGVTNACEIRFRFN